jgi:hypothetical protein
MDSVKTTLAVQSETEARFNLDTKIISLNQYKGLNMKQAEKESRLHIEAKPPQLGVSLYGFRDSGMLSCQGVRAELSETEFAITRGISEIEKYANGEPAQAIPRAVSAGSAC